MQPSSAGGTTRSVPRLLCRIMYPSCLYERVHDIDDVSTRSFVVSISNKRSRSMPVDISRGRRRILSLLEYRSSRVSLGRELARNDLIPSTSRGYNMYVHYNASFAGMSFSANIYICFFFIYFFYAHFHFPASGQAVVTGIIPSPRFLPSIFIAHRVQQSLCSSIVHRDSSVANSRSRAFRKSICPQDKVPTNLYGYALGGARTHETDLYQARG